MGIKIQGASALRPASPRVSRKSRRWRQYAIETIGLPTFVLRGPELRPQASGLMVPTILPEYSYPSCSCVRANIK